MVREIPQKMEFKQINMDNISFLTWTTVNTSLLVLYAGFILLWYRTGVLQLKLRDISGLLVLVGLVYYCMSYELDLQSTCLLLIGMTISYIKLSPVTLSVDKKAVLITGNVNFIMLNYYIYQNKASSVYQ